MPQPARGPAGRQPSRRSNANTPQQSNTALVLSVAILLFIAGSIAGYFIWKQAQTPEVLPPAYVNLGRVVAQVGGGRFVRTDVQLQISSAEYTPLFQSHQQQVMEGVRRGFGQISGDEIYTLEGKRAAQKAIAAHINHYFEEPLVEEVYFSGFLVAGG